MFKRVRISRGFLHWNICVFNEANVEIIHDWFLTYKEAKKEAKRISRYHDCPIEDVR